MSFEREERYVVIKLSKLNQQQKEMLFGWLSILNANARVNDALVIERDWPEYETYWKMIEARSS